MKKKGIDLRFNTDLIKYLSLIVFCINVFVLTKEMSQSGAGFLALCVLLYLVAIFPVRFYLQDHIYRYIKGRVGRRQYINACNYYVASLIILFVYSLVWLVLLGVFGNKLAVIIYSNSRIALCFLVIAPCILLFNLCTGICNYYQAMGIGRVVNIALILRQTIAFICSIYLQKSFASYGVKVSNLLRNEQVEAIYGVCGAFAGFCIGSAVGILVLFIFGIIFHREFSRLRQEDVTRNPETVMNLMISLLITTIFGFCSCVFITLPGYYALILMIRRHTAIDFISQMIFVGDILGKVFPILCLLILAFHYLHIGSIRKAHTFYRNEEYSYLRDSIQGLIFVHFCVGLFVAGAFYVLGDSVAVLIGCQGAVTCGIFVKLMGIIIFGIYGFVLFNKFLHIFQLRLFSYMSIAVGGALGLTACILLPYESEKLGFEVLYPMTIEFLVISFLMLFRICKKIHVSAFFLKRLGMFSLIGVGASFLMLLIYQVLGTEGAPLVKILACIIPGLILEVIGLVALRLFDENELRHLPYGSFIMYLLSFLPGYQMEE